MLFLYILLFLIILIIIKNLAFNKNKSTMHNNKITIQDFTSNEKINEILYLLNESKKEIDMDIKDIQLRNKIKNLMNSLDENDYYKLIYQIGFNDLLNPYGLFGSICVNKLIKKYGSEILKSKININTFPNFL